MKLRHRQFLHLAAVTAALGAFSVNVVMLSSEPAWPQARTIKLFVPNSPGGSLSILARLLAEQITRAQGSAIVVENRPGAGTIIGTEAVARAAPDGSSVLLNSQNLVITPHLRKANYDPLMSFEPICALVSSPTVIVVNSASPYRTLADLLNAARAKPGDLTLAASGPAGFFHIAVEILKRAANVNLTYIPYPGGAPAVNALLGQHVTSVLTDYATAMGQLQSGKLRALAIGSRTRIEPLPDLATVAESGYQHYDLDFWFGLFAPAKAPKETLSQLAGWFTTAMHVPDVKAKLAMQGLYPVGMCGAEFDAYLREQYVEYGRIIREANIKAE